MPSLLLPTVPIDSPLEKPHSLRHCFPPTSGQFSQRFAKYVYWRTFAHAKHSRYYRLRPVLDELRIVSQPSSHPFWLPFLLPPQPALFLLPFRVPHFGYLPVSPESWKKFLVSTRLFSRQACVLRRLLPRNRVPVLRLL